MKKLKVYAMLGFLTLSAASYAQVASPQPSVPAPVPESNPIPSNPTETPEKKAEFNAPQSPARPADVPAEDTLIKDQRPAGAVVHDTRMPASGKKNEKNRNKKDKMGGGQADTTSIKKP
ncbi:hypothetical protein [Dyadobacter sandarakinus]|uniref:Uncharacterized protein n=1 Tax=Dyadobacter sandarakinus TaxID=2747268 RepID=A0ABX7IB16_9BACT|nr:hypothetical protein [Dyadobacter sandarakinus]QRR03170.1 hypothetical protein HWI92_20765 [Dyadobacter sandarakinus]